MRAERLVLSEEGKAAVKKFRDAKPWRGTIEERTAKFETFHAELCAAAGLECGLVLHEIDPLARHGDGAYDPQGNRIILVRKLSVVTLLYCFGGAAGLGRGEALTWATGLFRHYFPRSFAACRLVRGRLVNEPDAGEDVPEVDPDLEDGEL
jgi:hypothetical protein